MKVKIVSPEKLYPVRHKVLRPGKPISSAYYDRDNDLDTIHFAFFEKSKICSIASFYPESFIHIYSVKAYRLRGMATLPSFRRKGYGRIVMREAIRHLKNIQCDMLWCKARIIAIPFYKSLGFEVVGNKYDIEDIGPHYTMYKTLQLNKKRV